MSEKPAGLDKPLHFHMSVVTIAVGQSAKDEGQFFFFFCATGQMNNEEGCMALRRAIWILVIEVNGAGFRFDALIRHNYADSVKKDVSYTHIAGKRGSS